ncbi:MULTISPECIES: DMT family transporter [unclassified Haladaptatus]|uniref:DMT family transporter n=1 Tax=unclassified Haladaptatus TaxID=2622732 RepID=UPI0023E8A472|nr:MULTISPECIES: DMT family transporter [unclassified Haladaptatus]
MPRNLTALLFALLGLLWGASFVAIEIGLDFFPPVLFAALRYYIAGAIMLGYAVSSTARWLPRSRAEWLIAGISGGFLIGGHHAFLYLGQQFVSGAIAAVIISLGPVLTTVFASALLPSERLRLPGLVGLGLGLLGVVIIANPDPQNLLTANVLGIALVFVASVCFALGAVLTRPIRTDFPVQSLQAWGMLLGAALLHLVALARGESMAQIAWTQTGILSLAYLAVGSGAVAFFIYFELLDRLGPIQINLIGYLEPVWATVLSFALLGSLVSAQSVLGFLAIFCGFALVKREALRAGVGTVVARVRQQTDS